MPGRVALYFITFYQRYIRALLPQACRFSPSCSEYAKAAVLRYGFFKGGGKALIRLLRCHPFSTKSGYDPLE
ncbi:MAG: membrane protein insertion efficiency factor YidD [Candidatus Omnitrophica bacterium]|nr:membrane protein insertion efficiency factor YidD [Candidatus Omnitrophota bacterium]MBL7151026.1 membrane protein insertion efficiency factor YidD [Candidatus Omnitrophota bacterium]MBL7210372.1 membrane protein insertion efficiency factor YidD [Candidatus Omnitrophota bacterium]